jgi:3-oxoacyl-ACP reductase-like protein
MFPVTVTINTLPELQAVMAALKAEAPAPVAEAKAVAPKPEKAKAAATPAAAPAPTAAPAASEPSAAGSSGISAEELTKVIVATVARTSREQVLAVLNSKFGVNAGKEITDPATRAAAAEALGAL